MDLILLRQRAIAKLLPPDGGFIHQSTLGHGEDGEAVVTLSDLERQHARSTLKRMHGNKVKTAEALGISRATLYRLLEEEDSTEARAG